VKRSAADEPWIKNKVIPIVLADMSGQPTSEFKLVFDDEVIVGACCPVLYFWSMQNVDLKSDKLLAYHSVRVGSLCDLELYGDSILIAYDSGVSYSIIMNPCLQYKLTLMNKWAGAEIHSFSKEDFRVCCLTERYAAGNAPLLNWIF
jgi:hypothetical protein